MWGKMCGKECIVHGLYPNMSEHKRLIFFDMKGPVSSDFLWLGMLSCQRAQGFTRKLAGETKLNVFWLMKVA